MLASIRPGPCKSEVIILSADARFVTFGSAADCDIPVVGSYVSRRHLRMMIKALDHTDKWAGFRVSVTDMGTFNGTIINKKKITSETVLKDGDTIAIGEAVYLFRHLIPPRRREGSKSTMS